MINLIQANKLLLKYYENTKKNRDFYKNDDYYSSLISHCHLVLDFGKLIIYSFDNLSVYLQGKAELACLLHDIGKFKILKGDYSIDHGDVGYKILLKENISEDIALSVKYHNKYNWGNFFNEKYYLGSKNKEDIEFLVKVNKDAGELANILDLIFSKRYLNLNEKSLLSDEVNKLIKEKKFIHYKYVKTELDYIFMRLSGIFDLNYEVTKKILFDYDIIGILEKNFIKKGLNNEIINLLKYF